MTIKLYVNDELTATAANVTAPELAEEIGTMCDELNVAALSGPLDVDRVDYIDADVGYRYSIIRGKNGLFTVLDGEVLK